MLISCCAVHVIFHLYSSESRKKYHFDSLWNMSFMSDVLNNYARSIFYANVSQKSCECNLIYNPVVNMRTYVLQVEKSCLIRGGFFFNIFNLLSSSIIISKYIRLVESLSFDANSRLADQFQDCWSVTWGLLYYCILDI